jgi:hypothetical protein
LLNVAKDSLWHNVNSQINPKRNVFHGGNFTFPLLLSAFAALVQSPVWTFVCVRIQDQFCTLVQKFQQASELENVVRTAMLNTSTSCATSGSTNNTMPGPSDDYTSTGQLVYSYVTPFVMVIGIIGNLVSLRVFMARRMRKMSASLYLASLALSDTFVIMSYVLVEWLHRGLPYWPGRWSFNPTRENQCKYIPRKVAFVDRRDILHIPTRQSLRSASAPSRSLAAFETAPLGGFIVGVTQTSASS